MNGELRAFVTVFLYVVASLCYCYFVSSRFSKPKYRLISLLPIFYLFTILPLSLSYVFTTFIASSITWLANFKLLLFAFDQGPLYPSRSLFAFITIGVFPINIKQQKDPSTERPQKWYLNLGLEILALVILAGGIIEFKDKVHPEMLYVVYGWFLFLFLEVLFGLFRLFIRGLVNVELEPISDEPYLSTSLQDFWGKRWNLLVTNILRQTIYKPVKIASTPLLGKNWAPLPAVLATFLVSGLMHELLLYYVTRSYPTWEMTLYFVLHGICLVLEFGLKMVFVGRYDFPLFVARALTMGFIVVTSSWLFFPPMVRNRADVRFLEEYMLLRDFIKTILNLK